MVIKESEIRNRWEPIHYDLIIVGSGLSALMAAKAAVEMGAKVLLIGKGTGSLCLFSNTIDLLGNIPDGTKIPDGLRSWIEDHPTHPYAKLDWERIEEAFSKFLSIFSEEYGFESEKGENCLIPTGAGTCRPTYLFPSTMKPAISLKRQELAVVGLKGFKDFYAPYAAGQFKCRSIVISPPASSAPEVTAIAVARWMERESFREHLAREIKKEMKGESQLGFPALLGMRDPSGVKKDLEERMGVEVFEIPILPPSIPGLRIFRRFKEWLIQRGVTILLGHSVSRPILRGKRCQGIEVSHPPLLQPYSGDRLLLATGRFMSGGLKAEQGKIVEPIFDLPVLQPESSEGWFSESFFDTHPIHYSGILTDSSFRPVDREGHPILENVWVAGSILSGHSCIQEKSREGIEIATGYWAARFALATPI